MDAFRSTHVSGADCFMTWNLAFGSTFFFFAHVANEFDDIFKVLYSDVFTRYDMTIKTRS